MTENKEKLKSLPVTDFYDLVFKIDSFRTLKKKEQGDYGWDILYSKDFDYDKRTKEELVRIGVVGNGNRGKSFILSKLTNFKVPSGFGIKTEGISLKYPDMKTKDGKVEGNTNTYYDKNGKLYTGMMDGRSHLDGERQITGYRG